MIEAVTSDDSNPRAEMSQYAEWWGRMTYEREDARSTSARSIAARLEPHLPPRYRTSFARRVTLGRQGQRLDYLLEVNSGPENRRSPAVANGGFGDTQLRTVPFREERHLYGSRGRPNGPAVKINRSGWSANQPLLMREA